MRAAKRRSCSSLSDLQPELDQQDAAVDDVASRSAGQSSRKRRCCCFGAEAHDVFDAGAVVPAAVEDDDFAGGREMLDVALHVHLRLLAIGRRRQRDDPEDARAHPLGDGLDRTALAGRVAALEDDDDPQPFLLDPVLQAAELRLQLAQLLLVVLSLHFGPACVFARATSRHDILPAIVQWKRARRSRILQVASRLDPGQSPLGSL